MTESVILALISRSKSNAGIGVIMNRTIPNTPSGTDKSRHGILFKSSAGAFEAFADAGLRPPFPALTGG